MSAERSRLRRAEKKAPGLRAGAARELVVWPIAFTLQHGSHLPTGTDAMINETLQACLIFGPLAGVAARLQLLLAWQTCGQDCITWWSLMHHDGIYLTMKRNLN